jgi:stage V sporulation protein AD
VFLNSSAAIERASVVTSSHNCAAERQFRTPIEYGGQRTPTAQWTATAAGAFILRRVEKDEKSNEKPKEIPCKIRDEAFIKSKLSPLDSSSETHAVYIDEVMAGKIVDGGVTDAANMGAAMAPAAADSIEAYLKESARPLEDFDAIITGDLGREGSEILSDLLLSVGINIKKKHIDCGMLMYDFKRQDAHSGASGCGCSASVMAAHFIPEMKRGKYKNIMFLATGALMSPSSIQQGGSIAGIAPVVVLRSGANPPRE